MYVIISSLRQCPLQTLRSRSGLKRNAATAALRVKVANVKKEKRAAQDDAEVQQDTTQQTALMLDRWMSYADELKKQVLQNGGYPLC